MRFAFVWDDAYNVVDQIRDLANITLVLHRGLGSIGEVITVGAQ